MSFFAYLVFNAVDALQLLGTRNDTRAAVFLWVLDSSSKFIAIGRFFFFFHVTCGLKFHVPISQGILLSPRFTYRFLLTDPMFTTWIFTFVFLGHTL